MSCWPDRVGILKGLTQTRGQCLPSACLSVHPSTHQSVSKRPRVPNLKSFVASIEIEHGSDGGLEVSVTLESVLFSVVMQSSPGSMGSNDTEG